MTFAEFVIRVALFFAAFVLRVIGIVFFACVVVFALCLVVPCMFVELLSDLMHWCNDHYRAIRRELK